MATREQLHKEVNALPDDQLDRAHLVIEPNGAGGSSGAIELNGTVDWNDDAWKDVLPIVGDVGNMALLRGGMSDEERKRQQESLREFQEELKAEGVEGGKYIDELRRRAATWPE